LRPHRARGVLLDLPARHYRHSRRELDRAAQRTAGRRALGLDVQRGLLLSGRERPGRARAALLAKDEAQLLRRAQLRLVGTERGAGLAQLERTEQVAAKEAFLAGDLPRRALALRSRSHPLPPGPI